MNPEFFSSAEQMRAWLEAASLRAFERRQG
jgi:hypothetical protein